MNAKIFKLQELEKLPEKAPRPSKAYEPFILFILLLICWFFLPSIIQGGDQTIGIVDQSIWVLIILSMICFMLICAVSWWLLIKFWQLMGLPDLDIMVSQFKHLSPWQQSSFFLASFVSLLLAAMGCLLAVC